MIGGCFMDATRYVKPCMTNLPSDLGKEVFKVILNTPKPDFTETDKEVQATKTAILARREYENNEGSIIVI